MGNTLDAGGKPVFAATPTQTVVDLQAAADFAKKYAFDRAGTASARTSIPAGELWDGLQFYETDTDSIYIRSSGAWKLWHRSPRAYTPTTVNVSGSPTVQGRYAVVAGMVIGSIYVLLNGANFGTAPTFSLPLAARAAVGVTMLGEVIAAKSNVWNSGKSLQASTTTIAPVVSIVASTLIGNSSNVSAATPFTWASGDTLNCTFTYEAA